MSSTPAEQYDAALQLANAGQVAQAHDGLVALLDQLNETDIELSAPAALLGGICSLARYDNERAETELRNAQIAFAKLGEAEAALYAELLTLRLLLDLREIGRVRDRVLEALPVITARGWTSAEALARSYLGLAHFHSRQHAQARGEIEQSLALANKYRLAWETPTLQITLAGCLAGLGETAAADLLYESSLAAVAEVPAPRVQVLQLINTAYRAVLARDYRRARENFAALLEVTSLPDTPSAYLAYYRASGLHNLGLIELELGNYGVAKRHLLRAWDKLYELNYEQLSCSCLTALSIIALLEGEAANAVHYAQASRQAVTVYGEIESIVVVYFLAIALLANNKLNDARALWADKPELECNTEVTQLIGWMRRELACIVAAPGDSGLELSAAVQAQARQWEDELAAIIDAPAAS
ncbi:hypothetical protein JW859_03525 [bacterium]|nr:hypothetical protein [bacterium]